MRDFCFQINQDEDSCKILKSIRLRLRTEAYYLLDSSFSY